MIDRELEEEILDGRPHFYAVDLVAGSAVRDGLTGRLIAEELTRTVAGSEAHKANEAHAAAATATEPPLEEGRR